MTGYDSYLSTLPEKPKYDRRVICLTQDAPLYTCLKIMGAIIETESCGTKILCNSDAWARSYQTKQGGIIEARMEGFESVVVTIDPSERQKYQDYIVPLPYWAYSMG